MHKFLTLCLATICLAVFAPAPLIAGEAESKDKVHECCVEANTCSACRDTCAKALAYCMKKGGKHAAADHLRTLMDCIDTCDYNSKLIARGSDLHQKASAICAEICARCAKSCAELEDPELKDCVDTCNTCASYCQGKS